MSSPTTPRTRHLACWHGCNIRASGERNSSERTNTKTEKAIRMNYLLIFAMLNVFVSCNNRSHEKPHNYKVTCFQRVGGGYHYSEAIFTYKSDTYRPIITAGYINDTLSSVLVFKSEGKVSYSRADIEADTLFFQTLNIPHNRIIDLRENQVIDNGKSHQITELIRDSIYSMQKGTLFLYSLN